MYAGATDLWATADAPADAHAFRGDGLYKVQIGLMVHVAFTFKH